MWCVIWRIWRSWNQPCVKMLMSWEVTAAPQCGSTLYWRGRLQQNQNQNIQYSPISRTQWTDPGSGSCVCAAGSDKKTFNKCNKHDEVSLKNSSGSIQDPHNNPGPVLPVISTLYWWLLILKNLSPTILSNYWYRGIWWRILCDFVVQSENFMNFGVLLCFSFWSEIKSSINSLLMFAWNSDCSYWWLTSVTRC